MGWGRKVPDMKMHVDVKSTWFGRSLGMKGNGKRFLKSKLGADYGWP